jgi:hypothetical protein
MAAFVRHGGRGTVLVNNHEVSGSEPYKVPPVPGFTFNPAAGGGTTTIEVDGDGNRLREYVSLAGTLNNCAGGRSPWGTWLSCEESESTVGGVRHGWVFEVDPYDQDANRDQRVHRADVLDGQEDAVRLHPVAGSRVRDHGAVRQAEVRPAPTPVGPRTAP